MLNSEKKKKNILTLVLSEKKILNETKNHNPPCKLNGPLSTSLYIKNLSIEIMLSDFIFFRKRESEACFQRRQQKRQNGIPLSQTSKLVNTKGQ